MNKQALVDALSEIFRKIVSGEIDLEKGFDWEKFERLVEQAKKQPL